MIIIFTLKLALSVDLPSNSQKQLLSAQASDSKAGQLYDSFSIIVSSYGFILNLFPVYTSIEQRNNKKGYQASGSALAFSFIVYVTFSFLAYYCYGESIQPSIFDNIKSESSIGSYITRLLFLVIFICNIPFLFLPAKECILVMIDEIQNRTVSMAIMKSIDHMHNGPLLDASNQSHKFYDDDNDFKVANISQTVSDRVYFITSITLFITVVLGGILINDLTIIFGFLASFSESLLNFILPGVLYIISCQIKKRPASPVLLIVSLVFIILGVILLIGGTYHTILKIQKSS